MALGERCCVYFAGPLFTQAEWQWNERLADELEKRSLSVIRPQRCAEEMLYGREKFDAKLLFDENIKGIQNAAVVIAVLDGADADSGTSWECGYAYKLGRPVIGVRSDIRLGGDDPQASVNLMLSMCCNSFITVPFEKRTDISWVADAITAAIMNVVRN